MVRLGFSDGDGYNKGKYERGGFHDNSFPLTPSKRRGNEDIYVNTKFRERGEKGLREAAYLNLTAASSIGKPAL